MGIIFKVPEDDTPFWHKHPDTKSILISRNRIRLGIKDIGDFIESNLDKPVAYVVYDLGDYQIGLYFGSKEDYTKFSLRWVGNDEYSHIDDTQTIKVDK